MSTFPMPVRSDGAASARSSTVSPYSNSNATMSRPAPSVKPRVVRLDGEVAVPMKTVASAHAFEAVERSAAPKSSNRASRISNDTIGAKAEQTMNVCLTDDQKLLRQTVREFAEAELRPHVMEWDEAQAFPRELLDQLAELGLMGIQFPEQYGGSAMSAVDYCIC